jgi:hypothetical protein
VLNGEPRKAKQNVKKNFLSYKYYSYISLKKKAKINKVKPKTKKKPIEYSHKKTSKSLRKNKTLIYSTTI